MGEEQVEDVRNWRDRVETWRGNRRVVAGVLACVAIAAAIAWWRAGAAAAPSGPSLPRGPVSTTVAARTTTTGGPDRLVVDVVGAVRTPGIVRVGAGARVVDAIAAAGGATADADLVRLNLAAPLADGARIAVPAIGRPPPALDPAAVSGAPAPDGATAGAPAGPVNINSATADALDKLPGIGPATAAAIVSDRSAHGPFASVDDLQRVRGIGPAKLEQLRDLVTV